MQSLLDVEELDWFKSNLSKARAKLKDITEENSTPAINGYVCNMFDARLQLRKSTFSLINSIVSMDDFIREYSLYFKNLINLL